MKILRRRILEELTDNLGDVIESGDKIICNVDEEIILKGHPLVFNTLNDYKKWIIEKYKVNKKIWFLIDGMTFDKPVYFTGLNDCNIYISNCEFKSSADFDIDGSIYFDNVLMNSCFISSNSLNIKRTNIRNANLKSTTDIALCGKRNVDIEDSVIGLENEKTNVYIVSTFLNLKSSNIKANVLKINSKDYDLNNTIIDANKQLINKEDTNIQKLLFK